MQISKDFNPPTLNTLHEIFAEPHSKLLSLSVIQTNTPTNDEEIDIVFTRGATTWTYDGSAIGTMTNAKEYVIYILMPDTTGAPYTLEIYDLTTGNHSFLLMRGWAMGEDQQPLKDIDKVEIRQTSAIAAGARIKVKATYETLVIV